jgi:hypothetical protein
MQDLGTQVRSLAKAFPAYAEMLLTAHSDIPKRPADSLTNSRKITELMLIELYQNEMGKEPRKPLLAEMLTDNQFTRKIDRRIYALMNAIRELGNLGPHVPPDQVRPSDAQHTLANVCEVLLWYGRRLGGGTTADERLGAQGTAPVSGLPPREQAGGSGGTLAVAADTVHIEHRILEVANAFWAGREAIVKSRKERCDLLARYFEGIAGTLQELADGVKQKQIPEGKLQEVATYAALLPDAVGDKLMLMKMQHLTELLQKALDVKTLLPDVNRDPMEMIAQIEGAAGVFRGLAASCRIHY